jgi:hypothetical protein
VSHEVAFVTDQEHPAVVVTVKLRDPPEAGAVALVGDTT